jgi:8-oxo-dGTP pyrophosphatase MutT (NUDIX family)
MVKKNRATPDPEDDVKGKRRASIIPQAAVLPIFSEQKHLFVLLITSMKRRRWILPKGIVEKDRTPEETAHIEAYEEAGIRGNLVGSSEGVYTYRKWGGLCRVDVFIMKVSKLEDDWPEKALRQRKRIPIEKLEDLIDTRIPPSLIRHLRCRAEKMSTGGLFDPKEVESVPEA